MNLADCLPPDIDWEAPAIADASRLVGILEEAAGRQDKRGDRKALADTEARLIQARRRFVEAALTAADGAESDGRRVVPDNELAMFRQLAEPGK